MKHLFSSGEILNHQHEKTLAEGRLIGDTLEYEGVGAETVFACHGKLDGAPVVVRFRLAGESLQHVEFRHMLGILMQSDIFEGVWEPGYEVQRTEH